VLAIEAIADGRAAPASRRIPMPQQSSLGAAAEPGYPPPRLMQMLLGLEATQMVYVVAKLGIPERLASGAKSVSALAAEVGADPSALRRLLRALVVEGLFEEPGPDCFALAADGHALRPGVPGSVHALAVMSGEPWYWQTYGRLLDSVRTGRDAFEPAHGMPLYTYLARDAEAGRIFSEFMHEHSVLTSPQILAAYDFGRFARMVDVGGGRASLLIRLLARHRSMRGVLFDAPAVLQGARPLLEAEGVADRCELVAGSFFEGVPAGGDAYLLRNVLHDWDDEHALAILRRCRAAIAPHGMLLISEAILPEGPASIELRYCDLQVMVTLGGRQRSGSEFAALLDAAGFRLGAIRPTGFVLSMVEAVPV
jgi:hypothetical protein